MVCIHNTINRLSLKRSLITNYRFLAKEMESHSHPFVSVIIPVYNDAERLKLCLEALKNQTYPKTGYEVIVVDNASDEAADIKGVVAQFGQAIAAYESTPGSYAARNKGISLAKGEVIAFTDADCIPDANWLESGLHRLLNIPNCGLVAGCVQLFFQDPQQATPVELYESITAFPQQRLLEQYQGAATANLFTFRRIFDQVGLFNASLRSNGDIDWGKRVYAAGYQQVYADDVCVAHPARRTFKQLYTRTARLAGGIYNRFILPEHSFIQRNKTFARLLVEDLIPPINFIISAFRDSRLTNWNQRFTVCWVFLGVRSISALEKIRLKLGGVPNRG